MIRINLLPEELQRAASTARNLFLALVAGVVCTAVFAVVVIFLYWNVLSMRDQLENRRIQVDLVKEKAYEVDRINEDIAFYKEREKAIIEIKTQRILWSKKLQQLAVLTPPDIWITRLSMRTLDPSEYKWDKKVEQTGGRLSLTCFAEGTEVSSLTNFRKALSGEQRFYRNLIDERALPAKFFGDFDKFLRPAWERVNLDGYQTKDNLRFELDLDLKPLQEPPAPKPKQDPKKKKKKKG